MSIVDSDGFKKFMSDVNPKFQVPYDTMYSDFSIKFMVFWYLGVDLSLEAYCLDLGLEVYCFGDGLGRAIACLVDIPDYN